MKVTTALAVMVTCMSAAGSFACAQPPEYSSQQQSCIRAARGDGDKIDLCAKAELGRQEAELEISYRTLYSQLSLYRKSLLRKSQKSWERFRQAECQLECTRVIGGPLGIIQRAQITFQLECMEKQTHLRVMGLQEDYDSQRLDPH